MARFSTDYVNLIANNLRDRYKSGFPILKELVQNADDAGATELAFGFHEGFVNSADHPLLQGPALWVLNNGRFNERDRKAIHAFGLNSKAAEAAAIGKFGLGMKSVFHLCESYFYVAFDGGALFREILNPWMQDTGNSPMHEQWEFISQRDMASLEQVARAQPEASAGTSWFLLWVPLRTHAHVASIAGKKAAAIIERYPGESNGTDLDFFNEPAVDQRIGALLPLLHNLEQIRFDGAPTRAPFKVRLKLDEKGTRLDHLTDAIDMAGMVIDDRPAREQLYFYGKQFVPANIDLLKYLPSSPGWPSSIAILEDGTRGQVADKARPEGSILMGHADNRIGRIVLHWAVFLPTEEIRYTYEAYIPNSAREYRVVLHGQFFVDAGRRGIEDMEVLHLPCEPLPANASQPMVLRSWNQTLAQQVILPGFLEVVAHYTRRNKLKDNEIRELTTGLQTCRTPGDIGAGVPFFTTFRRYICGQHAWLRQLKRTGPEWNLIAACATRLLPLLPPANHDHDRPWRALPGLAGLSDVIFFDNTAPTLAPEVDHWDTSSLLEALSTFGPRVLKSAPDLEYLVRFLEMEAHREIRNSQFQDAFVVLLRSALQEMPLAELRANRTLFRRLVSLLLPERRFSLGTRDPGAKGALPEAVYRRLVVYPTTALLLPGDLSPDDAAPPASTDINKWLQGLGAEIRDQSLWKEQNLDPLLEIADTLVKAAGNQDAQGMLVRSNAGLRVLRAFDARTGKLIATSLDELCVANRSQLLFKIADPRDTLGLSRELCTALPQLEVLVVRASTAQFVSSAYDTELRAVPTHTDESSVLRAVGAQPAAPRLGSMEARKALLSHAGSANLNDITVIRGLRYLLHGSAEHYRGAEALWRDPTGRQSPWVKLWRMLTESNWNVLADELCDCIPGKCLEMLGVRPVNDETVIKRLLTNPDFGAIRPKDFSDEDRAHILGRIATEDIWRRLPLHRDIDGHLGPIDSTCFLGSGPSLPPEVTTRLRLIEVSSETSHAQNQQRWISRWTASEAARAILGTAAPAMHWRLLMDLAASNSELLRDPPVEWMKIAWLPLREGRSISLDSLIALKGLEHEIASLAEKCEFAFAGPSDLAEELQRHPGFTSLMGQVSQGESAVPVLGEMMGAAGLRIGRIPARLPIATGRLWSTLSRLTALPAWALLEKVADVTSVEAVVQHVLPRVAGGLSVDQAQSVLEELGTFDLDTSVRDIYLAYLQEWCSSGQSQDLRERLAGMLLPSAAKTWEPASEVTHGVMGVEQTAMLDDGVARLLQAIIATNSTPPESMTVADGTDTWHWDVEHLVRSLEVAFEPLFQGSVQAAAGAVVGLFGDSVASVSKKWLEPIAYPDYLNYLGWKDPGREDGIDRRLKWMGGKSVTQALATLRPMLKVIGESHVTVSSILGDPIEVRLLPVGRSHTLLAGAFQWQGGNGVTVSLRAPETLLEFEASEQKAILRRTAEEMLVHLYNQPHANLSALWGLFEQADQVTLDVARGLILDGLPQFLRQLGRAGRNSKIAEALAEMDSARRDLASARQARRDSQLPQQKVDAALATLAQIVENDGEVQSTLLDCIRERVTQNQYEVSSIPFELFQNADDAVFELRVMYEVEGRAPPSLDQVGRFVVQQSDHSVRFVHWGRLINDTGRSHGELSDYANDLERMLMLGASSKLDGSVVTGKFGLGFKSVLLATDKPRIWSGELHFEILAGCLPRRWVVDADTRRFQKEQQHPSEKLSRTTLIELPLTSAEQGRDLTARFAALASLSVIFSRHIKRISVDGELHAWSPKTVLEDHGWCIEVGTVRLPTKTGFTTSRMLVLRLPEAAIALRLDATGIAVFDDMSEHAAPSIWVTAPTRGTAAKGVLINAEFEVDTGRASLAQGRAALRNKERARRLAEKFAAPVAALQRRVEEDWPAFAAELGCDRQPSAARFWFGLWQVLFAQEADADAAEDVSLVAAFVDHLFSRSVTRTGRIANGMEDESAAFISMSDRSLYISRDRFAGVLPALRSWPTFAKRYPATGWCADEVSNWIGRACENSRHDIPVLNPQVVMSAVADYRLDPEAVEHLSAVLAAWLNRPGNILEEQSWRKALAEVTLLSRAAKWIGARHLLHSRVVHSELLKDFAPSDNLLDEKYERNGASWIRLSPHLPASQLNDYVLATWCLGAESRSARCAAVRWLVHNQHSPIMGAILSVRAQGGWLFGLTSEHEAMQGLPAEDRTSLLAKLGLEGEGDVPDVETPSVQFSLPTLWKWWHEQRDRLLQKYESQLWPAGFDRKRLGADPIDREAWMTLFSLAIFRRYGRTTDAQHKGFLHFLDTHGWWETICHVDPQHAPEQWMDILRQYGEAQLSSPLYEQWMDSFPRLYRLARWLDDYVHLFRTIDLRTKEDIAELLTPAVDASLSGSGIEAPTLTGMLRLGRHLVVRELLRSGVLHSPLAESLAYMPRSSLLALMGSMGYSDLGSSKDMHEALVQELGEDGARFEGDYDIPLQMVAANPALQLEILHWASTDNWEGEEAA